MKQKLNYTPVMALVLCSFFTMGVGPCATVQPGNDAVVVHAEQTYQEAFDASDALFKLDKINRAIILQTAPEVHAQINALKPKVKQVLANANSDIKTYKANRTTANLAKLNAAIAALTQILEQIRDQQSAVANASKTNP